MTLTVQLSTDSLTATVSSDAEVHPDLLDEMTARVLQLFIAGNASLGYEDEGAPDAEP